MRKHICSHVFLQIWLTVTFGYESCSFSLIGLYLGLNSYSSRQKEEDWVNKIRNERGEVITYTTGKKNWSNIHNHLVVDSDT